jgi:DNA (cytosine-5)-methyltransferase 1
VIYGSVCSGIEAATAAWHPLGWKASFFSEIEAFPRSVLAHHYPETPLHGDFTTIKAGHYEPIDLLVGGTPCQSFSVAGLRGGLDDDRGNLALEYLRLAHRLRPRWLVWENVPGVLSSNGGGDFGSILGGMVELGYGVAYRVLDAQFFGVAQRRRRVFVVGYLGDWRRAAAVLFERHSLSGNPAPRREAGEGSPARALLGALDGEFNPTGDLSGPITTGAAHTNRSSVVAFDTTQITSPQNRSNSKPGDPCYTLAKGSHAPAIAFGGDIARTLSRRHDGSPCADRGPDVVAVAFAIQERAVCENPNAGPDGAGFRSDDAAYTLEARTVPQAVAFMENQRGEVRHSDVTNLTVGGGKPGQGYPAAFVGSAVRRLTPRECERLQGFPDDFTLVPHRGKPAADGPRYKALGNSMAVPCMTWIGRRIDAVDALPINLSATENSHADR